MEKERPHKDEPSLEKLFGLEYSLYNGKDRSNLELLHNRTITQATKFSQNGWAILAFGIAFVAFLIYLLDGWIRFLICFVFFSLVLLSALKRFFYSWGYFIKAEFIERKLGVHHTWGIKQFDGELEKFKKYEYDEKLKQPRERKYYKFVDKILKRLKILKYIP